MYVIHVVQIIVGWLFLVSRLFQNGISVYIEPSLRKRKKEKEERIYERKKIQTTSIPPAILLSE